jgi:hypothetical protein
MRGVSRLRRVVVLLMCVAVVAVLAGLSLADPFHLRQARWFTVGLIAVGLALLTALLATAAPRGPLRWVTLVVGVAALLGWAALVYGASTLTGGGRQVAEADDNTGRRLVVLEGTLEVAGAPVYAVVLRSGGGPFEQESLVYQGLAGAPAPSARFVDPGTVEVAVGTCRYRSGVETVTLAVEPVHRPLVLGC